MGLQQSGDPDLAQMRSGGGCLSLFGLPFFLAGIFVMAVSVGAVSVKGDDMPWYFGVPFGGVFAAVGAAFLFGRAGVILDRRRGVVVSWWGLLVPFKRKERPLEAFERVTIRCEVRRSKDSTYTVYPVRLAGEGEPVDLEEPRSFDPARALAEEVAKFLDLPVEDRTGGKPVVRQAHELDQSLREQVQAAGTNLSVGEAPAGMQSTVQPQGDELVIEIPPSGMTPMHIAQAVLGLVFPTIVFFVFLLPMLNDDMPGPVKLVFLAFVGGLFMLMPLLMITGGALTASRRSFRVLASPRVLRVEDRGMVFTKVREIPTDELEELEVQRVANRTKPPISLTGGLGLVARSDKCSISFGGYLKKEEAEYLCALIKAVVTV